MLALGAAQMGNWSLTSDSRLAKLSRWWGLVSRGLFKWLKSSGLGRQLLHNHKLCSKPCHSSPSWSLTAVSSASEELFALHRKMPALLYSLE